MAEEKDKGAHAPSDSSGSSSNGRTSQDGGGQTVPAGNKHNPQSCSTWSTLVSGTYVYPHIAPAPEVDGQEFDETQGEKGVPNEDKRLRRRKWMWIVGVMLAAIAIFLFFRFRTEQSTAAKGAAAKEQQASAAINVGQATTGDMNIYVDALGTVTPVNTVTLYSQITGQVVAVHYREGQMVSKGDPLIDIDPRPYESTLTQAEGNLEHDQGVLAEARMDLQRYQTALQRNAIARQQLEDQAQAVVQYEGTVKADEGTVAYDRVQLSYCHIVAPITGQVGLRLVDPGNTVFAGSASTLVVITELQPITVVFSVSEDDLPDVQAQLRGGRSLAVDAFDRAHEKQLESGMLTSVDNEVDTTTGTIKFRAEFPNKNLSLYPNQFVNARLLVKTLHKVTLVPSAAVQHNGTNAFVYLVNSDNTVAVQQIKTPASNDQETAVEGVNAGAKVATSGFDRLEGGVHVTFLGQPGQQKGSPQQGQAGKKSSGGSKAP